MRRPTRAPDAVIIGAGVIGLAVAWRAARAGLRVVVCGETVEGTASLAAAGMLAPATEVHYGEETLLALTMASNARYPSFVAELEEESGVATGYRQCGTLAVARDADDKVFFDDLAAFQQRLGLEVETLRGRECRELEPGLARTVRGGILVKGDHQIDNRTLFAALQTACGRAGVDLVRLRVGALDVQTGRVAGVVLEDGSRIACGRVVLAAGSWSGSIEGLPQGAVPVRPVKGQVVHLRAPDGVPIASRNVRGVAVYVVPRADGRCVVGATVEERGFDAQVTAGGVFDLLRRAYELLPGIIELELTECTAGFRPGSPDNAPLLGEGIFEGLVLATGHFRNGILLTPVTGDSIAELLVSGRTPELIAPFSPARFAEVPT